MLIQQMFEITLFDPTVNRGAWTILLLMPVILLIGILLPKFTGKRGVIIASLGSLVPLLISFVTFLWAVFMTKSAIVNVPASSLEITLFGAISTTLVTLFFGTVFTLLGLFSTALFSILFKESRGKAVLLPITLILFATLFSGWCRTNILKYHALGNAASYDNPTRSKVLESLFVSDATQRRINEHVKYEEYAVRFYITENTLYNSVNERTEEVDMNGVKPLIINRIGEFYKQQEQLYRYGLISGLPTEQTILFESVNGAKPIIIDSLFVESLKSSGFSDVEIRYEERIEEIKLTGTLNNERES